MSNIMTLGEKLSKLRKMKNLSQGEVAKKLGLDSYQAIQKYEKDKSLPNINQIKQLASIYEVSPCYLMFDDAAEMEKVCLREESSEEIQKAKKVLASNTHYAKSLKMNIDSFYTGMETEQSLERRVRDLENKMERFITDAGGGSESPFAKTGIREQGRPDTDTGNQDQNFFHKKPLKKSPT
jgi:transcriptional regulator with XRE-family HTH domain